MRLPVNHALPLAALLLLGGALAGCGGGGGQRSEAVPIAPNGPAADYPVLIGESFTIDGVTYTPSDKLNYDAVGYASAAPAGGSHVSIAHKTLPVPSYAEVTALDSGKTILVRVERRGPMDNDKIVELSPGAAEQLGLAGSEKVAIRIRRVNPPEAERAMLRGGNQAPNRMDTPPSLLTVLRRKLDPTLAPMPVASPSPAATGLPPVASSTPAILPSSRPKVSPTVRPQPAPAPVPGPVPVRTSAASAPATAQGHFVVQVGTFSIAENGRRAAAKVGGRSIESGRMWRVRMGPFATRAQASAAQARARAAGFPEARIENAD